MEEKGDASREEGEGEGREEESDEGASGNAEIKVDRCFCKAAQSFNKDRIAEREGSEDRRAFHATYHTSAIFLK